MFLVTAQKRSSRGRGSMCRLLWLARGAVKMGVTINAHWRSKPTSKALKTGTART